MKIFHRLWPVSAAPVLALTVTLRRLVAALATLALLVAFMPAAAAAGPTVYVYHGTITGGELFECTGESQGAPEGWVLTSGRWTATISPGMAQISANEFHDFVGDGSWVHWTAFGGASWGKWDVIGTPAPGSFHLSMDAFGGAIQIDAYLEDGELLFVLEPYGDCASAEVYGDVTWSNVAS